MNSTGKLMLLTCATLCACSETDETAIAWTADRVFVNGAVYTVDDARSWSEAVAIDDGRIVYVGDDAGADNWIGEATEVVDLGGQMMLPGFHDSHIHILTGIMADEECDLLRIPTAREVAEKLQECTGLIGIGDDSWNIGGGWGEWLWPEANPRRGLLDIWYSASPVFPAARFGHGPRGNSRA